MRLTAKLVVLLVGTVCTAGAAVSRKPETFRVTVVLRFRPLPVPVIVSV
jgi:hypothetical protein